MKLTVSVVLICLLMLLPVQFKQGQLVYPQAEALVGRLMLRKLMLKAVKFEADLILKSWLKSVTRKEGKRVAFAALKSLKTLPQDDNFRLALITALAGGSYYQALSLTQQRSLGLMKSGSQKQWQADKQRLATHPELALQSFSQSAGDTVEAQWNDVDDQLSCGANNKDIAFQKVQMDGDNNNQYHYVINDTPNETLLTGRALLQRLLLKNLMKNSQFKDPQQAQKTARFYAHLACISGRSRKVIAFIGGIAVHGKEKLMKLQDIRNESLLFMDKINQWAQQKL